MRLEHHIELIFTHFSCAFYTILKYILLVFLKYTIMKLHLPVLTLMNIK